MESEKRQVAYSTLLVSIISIILIIISVTYILTIIKEQKKQTETYLYEVAIQSQHAILKQINGDLQTLQGMSSLIGMFDSVDIELLMSVLTEENDKNNFLRMGFVDLNGMGWVADVTKDDYFQQDFSSTEYIQKALSGEEIISNTLRDPLGAGWINAYAVPIFHDGQIIGALCAVNKTEALSNIIDASMFNNSGYAHIIDSKGDVVIRSTHKNSNKEFYNIFALEFTNHKMAKELKNGLSKGGKGFFSFTYDYIDQWASYAPIGINDWYIVSIVPKDAVNQNFSKVVSVSIFAILIIILLFILLSTYVTSVTKRSRSYITKLAYYDEVTGSYNKNKFFIEAKQILIKKEYKYAFGALDIDNFKLINELFGFSQGDLLLKHISHVLSESLSQNEMYYRDTADRFGFLLQFTDTENLRNRIYAIMDAISAYTFGSGRKYNIVCSAGVKPIGYYHKDDNADLLMDRAFFALGESKNVHANMLIFYDNDLHNKITHKNKIEESMKSALENHEFVVYMQPKYNLNEEKVVGAEALVRWNDPTYGIIPPDSFIPIFEQNGFITDLDIYVLNEVCQTLRNWKDKGYPIFPISVNQSRLLFYKEDYFDFLECTLQANGISPSQIILEITESIAIEDMYFIQKIVARLHELGFSISMDDFGSGYSSLNILQSINIDELKLDRVFLSNSQDDEKRNLIIRKIVELAKELSISTVAEGVETKEQAELLKQMGCDIAQGYFFSKPIPIRDFEDAFFHSK